MDGHREDAKRKDAMDVSDQGCVRRRFVHCHIMKLTIIITMIVDGFPLSSDVVQYLTI